jgi:long-chain fatty acid transport protein
MNNTIRKTFTLFLFLLAPAALFATDGYFANGYGTACKAMAGACVALPTDAASPATNPAAVSFLGTRYDLALGLFNPNREYTVIGTPSGALGTFGLASGRVESDSRYFFVPSIGAAWKGTGRTSFGLAIYGNGGMNTDYDAATFGRRQTGVDLRQLFFAPTVSVKLGEDHSLGISAIGAYQQFKADGLAAFGTFSRDAERLTNNGPDTSYGYGARVGYLGRLHPGLSVGLSYQTRIKMGRFHEYSGLFADHGSFDIPPSWVAGITARPVSTVAASVNVERIYYSHVDSVANPLLPNLMTARLGDAGGAGFGWRDTTTWKLGMQWEPSAAWTVRAGYSQGNQPVPSSQVLFNILAPGVEEKHATIGLAKRFGSSLETSFSLMRAFSNTVTGPNPLEVPGQQRIKLKMDEWESTLGLALRF